MPSESTVSQIADDRPTHEWALHADRLAPLIDGEEYFAAVRSSMIEARKQIFILGWEIHSEVELLRGDRADELSEEDGYPVVLTDLLRRLVEEREDLRVYLLIWSGASLFALEREHLPRMKRPWEQHPRIHLEWAEDTPPLGSHHQKVVVIDDRVVFSGGMDLTKARWDRHEHRIDDTRRKTPGLVPHYSKPYHDTMAVFEGEIARTLGDFARERWKHVTTNQLDPPELEEDKSDSSPWPRHIEPMLTDREVFVALTQPDHAGQPEKRQVEASIVGQIRSAERLIYIETQYLTASHIADELAERLSEENGPEIVIVLPYGCPGVVQSLALDHQRDRLIRTLRNADPGGRLGIYWPTLAGGDCEEPHETSVYVHAKVMVIDDRILRIGSANLNNRSMGLDTELDTWVETGDDEENARESIARFRRRSIAYLLKRDAQAVAEAEREHGSLIGAIESLRGGEQTLHPFEHDAPELSKAAALDIRLADPDRPLDEIDADKVFRFLAEQTGLREQFREAKGVAIGAVRRHKAWFIVAAILLAIGAVVWFTPLGNRIAAIDAQATMQTLRDSPLSIFGVFLVLVGLGSVGFPITALIVTTGAVIGAWWAAPLAMLGVLVAAAPGFAFGRLAPKSMTRPLTEGKLGGAIGALQKHGVLAVAAIRNLPVAPFAVVNTTLGVTGLSWTNYLLGTAIGMLPGVVLLSLFGQGLMDLITNPTPTNIAILAGILIGIIGVSLLMQHLLKHFAPGRDEEPDQDS